MERPIFGSLLGAGPKFGLGGWSLNVCVNGTWDLVRGRGARNSMFRVLERQERGSGRVRLPRKLGRGEEFSISCSLGRDWELLTPVFLSISRIIWKAVSKLPRTFGGDWELSTRSFGVSVCGRLRGLLSLKKAAHHAFMFCGWSVGRLPVNVWGCTFGAHQVGRISKIW